MQTKKNSQLPTGNHGSLRYSNLTSVLRLIYDRRPISRVELSRLTGLNKATVSSLVADLVDRGFVRFIGENRPERAGRREVMIDIAEDRASVVSVEIGVGFISAMAVDLSGEVRWRTRVEDTHDRSAVDVLKMTATIVAQAIAKGESNAGPAQGIAVGLPGIVDLDSGTLLFAPNLAWDHIKIRDNLSKKFDVPIYVDNEASLAALGEHFFGSARGFDEVLYISAGIGIGGGIITGGHLYRGCGGIAGEFGHMTVDLRGERCGCGRLGCWETIASESALFKAMDPSANSRRHKGSSDVERLESIRLAASAGRTQELNALAEIGKNLAIGIDSLANIFDPELIVLGGPLSSLHEFLIPAIQSSRSANAPSHRGTKPLIVPSLFGPDASMMGGAAHIIRNLLADPDRSK